MTKSNLLPLIVPAPPRMRIGLTDQIFEQMRIAEILPPEADCLGTVLSLCFVSQTDSCPGHVPQICLEAQPASYLVLLDGWAVPLWFAPEAVEYVWLGRSMEDLYVV